MRIAGNILIGVFILGLLAMAAFDAWFLLTYL